MDKITQAELITEISKQTNYPKRLVKGVLDSTTEAIKGYAKNGQAVAVPGLGVFKPVDRAAKTGRNPKTGEAIQIPAKRVLTFKPSSKMDLGAE